jgi:hypothetical protein
VTSKSNPLPRSKRWRVMGQTRLEAGCRHAQSEPQILSPSPRCTPALIRSKPCVGYMHEAGKIRTPPKPKNRLAELLCLLFSINRSVRSDLASQGVARWDRESVRKYRCLVLSTREKYNRTISIVRKTLLLAVSRNEFAKACEAPTLHLHQGA